MVRRGGTRIGETVEVRGVGFGEREWTVEMGLLNFPRVRKGFGWGIFRGWYFVSFFLEDRRSLQDGAPAGTFHGLINGPCEAQM